MKKTIQEFKLWMICLLVGTLVLSAEIAVKANVSNGKSPNDQAALRGDNINNPKGHVSPTDLGKAPYPDRDYLVTQLLVESVIQIESAGDPRTIGLAGERGLMQIMPGTWQDTTCALYGKPLSFRLAFNPALNREVGTAYLAKLHQFLVENRVHWRDDERSLLLACYNAGPNRVLEAGFDIKRLPASTRDYIVRASTLHDALLQDYALKIEDGGSPQSIQIVQTRRLADS